MKRVLQVCKSEKEPSRRVFCFECKHYSNGYSDRMWEACAKAKVSKTFNYLGPLEVVQSPDEKNADNNCTDFSRGPNRHREW